MVARRALKYAAALALALGSQRARAEGGGDILRAELSVDVGPGVRPDGPLRATLELNPSGVGKASSAREWFPDARASEGHLTVVLEGRAPAARSRPSPAHRRASFLVDFDHPRVAALRAEVRRRYGATPSGEDLARFVDGWIEHKSMSELMDVASVVAERREGDCSEHAVLLAAVARLLGRPARVVEGIALVPVDGALRAFGHAWAEIHERGSWRTVDATPLPSGVRYLPLAALVDEGPGYTAGALGRLSPIDVRRIVVERGR